MKKIFMLVILLFSVTGISHAYYVDIKSTEIEGAVKGGTAFEICSYSASVESTTNVTIYVSTPTGDSTIRLKVVDCGHGGDAAFYIYETPTISGGTAITPANLDFNSSFSSVIVSSYSVTIVSSGTKKCEAFLADATQGNGLSGVERILDRDKSYLFILNNLSGGTDDMSLKIIWIEEDE